MILKKIRVTIVGGQTVNIRVQVERLVCWANCVKTREVDHY